MMLIDTLTKIEALPLGQWPTDRVLVELGLDLSDGLYYFVTTDVQSDEFELEPADLAAYLHSAIEAAHADPGADIGDWEGISLMVVRGEDIWSDVGGWICKKCELIVAGAIEGPPTTCPLCETRK